MSYKKICLALFIGFFGMQAKGVEAATKAEPTVVIAVNFQDQNVMQKDTYYHNLIFDLKQKSVANYYKEISYGKIQINPVKETAGIKNDGIIRVNVASKHPDVGGEYAERSTLVHSVLKEALKKADPYINYAQYDKNKDGKISRDELHIIFVFAGFDTAMINKSPSIWSHSGSLYDVYKVDNVQIGNYENDGGYIIVGDKGYEKSIGNTTKSSYLPSSIGVYAHEFGHEFNLPDLYDADGSSPGIGPYSLMSNGMFGSLEDKKERHGETPVHMDAWSKIKAGFVKPTVVTKSGEYTMYESTNPHYNVLKIPTSNQYQYYLVENRQLKGFDAGLKGFGEKHGGIAIWYINDEVWGNADEDNKQVSLINAGERAGQMGYSDYQPFFRKGYVDRFGLYKEKETILTNGKRTNVSIVVKNGSSSKMRVQVTVPKETVKYKEIEKPANFKASVVTKNSVTLTWNAVKDASYYIVTQNGEEVYRGKNLTFTDKNLSPNSSYGYTVRSSNGYYESEYSIIELYTKK